MLYAPHIRVAVCSLRRERFCLFGSATSFTDIMANVVPHGIKTLGILGCVPLFDLHLDLVLKYYRIFRWRSDGAGHCLCRLSKGATSGAHS
jgi:hypothetical protein